MDHHLGSWTFRLSGLPGGRKTQEKGRAELVSIRHNYTELHTRDLRFSKIALKNDRINEANKQTCCALLSSPLHIGF